MAIESNDRLFTPEEVTAYLERIGLKDEDLDGLNQTERLKKLHSSHMLNVPFDTTQVHLPAKWWTLKSSIPAQNSPPVDLNPNTNHVTPELVPVDRDLVFQTVVKERRGAYCWSLNSGFARLLLSMGYRLTQLPARVFIYRHQDPRVVGYGWTPMGHHCLLVDTESGKFVCDVGCGSGSAVYPVPFEENIETETLTLGEKFKLVRECCPGLDGSSTGQTEGYTLQRWCGKWWSPVYHLYLTPLAFVDLELFNWYNTSYPRAYFKSLLTVSRLRADGSRRTLVCGINKDGDQSKIKVFTKPNVTAEETNVRHINPTYSDLYQALKEEFDWGPL